MIELHERIPLIESKADLVEFVAALARDLQNHRTEWENDTLERYLAALARWLDDSDGYYQNHNLPVPTHPSWRNIADMLIAAKMYE